MKRSSTSARLHNTSSDSSTLRSSQSRIPTIRKTARLTSTGSINALASMASSPPVPIATPSREPFSSTVPLSAIPKLMSLAPSHASPLATPPRRRMTGIVPSSTIRRSAAPLLNAYGLKATSTLNESPFNGSHRRNASGADRICVCIRKRPLHEAEQLRGESDIIQIDAHNRNIILLESKKQLDGTAYFDQHSFFFDHVFPTDISNHSIYSNIGAPLISHVFNGGYATCFAYGQTGSGKTHTIMHENDGLYILAARDIFQRLNDPNESSLHASLSLYEIYQGHLYDLLNGRRQVFAREDAKKVVQISDLQEVVVESIESLMNAVQAGLSTRSVGSTEANKNSSRSHAILQISLRKDESPSLYGRFTFIDLAGSERGSDRAKVGKQTKMEGSEINKSLLALKECIRAIDQGAEYLPFRQSKLTLVLKDSFVGDARTCMIATVAPTAGNAEHTLNTIRYADRVKELRGSAGENKNDKEVMALKQEKGDAHQDERSDNFIVSTVPPQVTPTTKTSASSTPLKHAWEVSPLALSIPSNRRLQKHSTHSTIAVHPLPATVRTKTALTRFNESRQRVLKQLEQLTDAVEACKETELLELLEDELVSLTSAFSTMV